MKAIKFHGYSCLYINCSCKQQLQIIHFDCNRKIHYLQRRYREDNEVSIKRFGYDSELTTDDACNCSSFIANDGRQRNSNTARS